jgi:hypothetical protein
LIGRDLLAFLARRYGCDYLFSSLEVNTDQIQARDFVGEGMLKEKKKKSKEEKATKHSSAVKPLLHYSPHKQGKIKREEKKEKGEKNDKENGKSSSRWRFDVEL